MGSKTVKYKWKGPLKMAKNDYIPKRDNDFLDFLKRLRDSLPGQQAALGISDDDVASVQNDTTLFEGRLKDFDDADAQYSRASASKTMGRSQVEARVRAIVRRIKSSSGYNESIGQLLKVIGPEDSTDLTASKPDLTGAAQAHGAELSFTRGKSDGVNIYSKRDGETDFVFLARDTAAPYVDNRALLAAGKPEVRHYRARYVSGDDEVGNFSDEVVVTVQP